MMQAVENKPMPGFFDEAVCHGFSTPDSRPLVSDASGR